MQNYQQNPYNQQGPYYQQNQYNQRPGYPQPISGYAEMAPHVLLLIFTLGIYHFYWIYKMTRYLNTVSREQRNETTELLLSIFVPFYYIFWYYKTAEIVDAVDYKNPNSDFKTLTLVFAIFIPLVSAIMVQDRVNKMCNPPVQNYQQNYQQNQYNQQYRNY